MHIKTWDGIDIYVLPEGAVCTECMESPLDIMDCPTGHINCVPDICDSYEERKTATWVPERAGGFTPGGNPIYHCSNCGYVYGSHELYPQAKYCKGCERRMVQR